MSKESEEDEDEKRRKQKLNDFIDKVVDAMFTDKDFSQKGELEEGKDQKRPAKDSVLFFNKDTLKEEAKEEDVDLRKFIYEDLVERAKEKQKSVISDSAEIPEEKVNKIKNEASRVMHQLIASDNAAKEIKKEELDNPIPITNGVEITVGKGGEGGKIPQIDLPDEIKNAEKMLEGVVSLSFAFVDEKGENMPEDKAVYFGATYVNGKLVDIHSPAFDKKSDPPSVTIDGQEYFAKVSKETLERLQAKLVENRREADLERQKGKGKEEKLENVVETERQTAAEEVKGKESTFSLKNNKVSPEVLDSNQGDAKESGGFLQRLNPFSNKAKAKVVPQSNEGEVKVKESGGFFSGLSNLFQGGNTEKNKVSPEVGDSNRGDAKESGGFLQRLNPFSNKAKAKVVPQSNEGEVEVKESGGFFSGLSNLFQGGNTEKNKVSPVLSGGNQDELNESLSGETSIKPSADGLDVGKKSLWSQLKGRFSSKNVDVPVGTLPSANAVDGQNASVVPTPITTTVAVVPPDASVTTQTGDITPHSPAAEAPSALTLADVQNDNPSPAAEGLTQTQNGSNRLPGDPPSSLPPSPPPPPHPGAAGVVIVPALGLDDAIGTEGIKVVTQEEQDKAAAVIQKKWRESSKTTNQVEAVDTSIETHGKQDGETAEQKAQGNSVAALDPSKNIQLADTQEVVTASPDGQGVTTAENKVEAGALSVKTTNEHESAAAKNLVEGAIAGAVEKVASSSAQGGRNGAGELNASSSTGTLRAAEVASPEAGNVPAAAVNAGDGLNDTTAPRTPEKVEEVSAEAKKNNDAFVVPPTAKNSSATALETQKQEESSTEVIHPVEPNLQYVKQPDITKEEKEFTILDVPTSNNNPVIRREISRKEDELNVVESTVPEPDSSRVANSAKNSNVSATPRTSETVDEVPVVDSAVPSAVVSLAVPLPSSSYAKQQDATKSETTILGNVKLDDDPVIRTKIHVVESTVPESNSSSIVNPAKASNVPTTPRTPAVAGADSAGGNIVIGSSSSTNHETQEKNGANVRSGATIIDKEREQILAAIVRSYEGDEEKKDKIASANTKEKANEIIKNFFEENAATQQIADLKRGFIKDRDNNVRSKFNKEEVKALVDNIHNIVSKRNDDVKSRKNEIIKAHTKALEIASKEESTGRESTSRRLSRRLIERKNTSNSSLPSQSPSSPGNAGALTNEATHSQELSSSPSPSPREWLYNSSLNLSSSPSPQEGAKPNSPSPNPINAWDESQKNEVKQPEKSTLSPNRHPSEPTGSSPSQNPLDTDQLQPDVYSFVVPGDNESAFKNELKSRLDKSVPKNSVSNHWVLDVNDFVNSNKQNVEVGGNSSLPPPSPGRGAKKNQPARQ